MTTFAESIMEKYIINEQEASDDALFDALINFFGTIDPDSLTDTQLEAYDVVMEIMEEMEGDGDDEDEGDGDGESEEDEEVSEVKRVRINRQARRKHQKYYRKNKAKIKAYQKKYQRTAAYKKATKMRKRRVKMGKVKKYV
jgi:hypothetical protein